MKSFLVLFILVMSSVLPVPANETAATPSPQPFEKLTLTLKQACDLCLIRNKTLKSAVNGLERSRVQLESRQSDFYWALSPAGELGASDGDEYGGIAVIADRKFFWGPEISLKPYTDRSAYTYECGLMAGLQVPLLRGRGRLAVMDGIESAAYSERLSEYSFEKTRISVLLGVIETYYYVQLQEKILNMYSDHYRFFEGQVETIRLKENLGLATSMDVYRARLRLTDDADKIAEARNSRSNYEDQLKEMLSLPMDRRIQLAPIPEVAFDIPDEEQATEAALVNRTEVVSAMASVKEAARQARIARHNLMPELDLSLSYQQYGISDSLSEGAELDEHTWHLSLGSTTDFFRRTEKADFRQKLIAVRNAELGLDSVRQSVAKEVRSRLEALEKTKEQIRLRRQSENVARGKKELSLVKYMQGLSDNADTIDAEIEWLQARENRMVAEIAHEIGIYQLQATMGVLIPADGLP